MKHFLEFAIEDMKFNKLWAHDTVRTLLKYGRIKEEELSEGFHGCLFYNRNKSMGRFDSKLILLKNQRVITKRYSSIHFWNIHKDLKHHTYVANALGKRYRDYLEGEEI